MQPISINERIEKIKNSNDEIDILIEEYKPFIASSVYKHTGRFLKYGVDDELSVGLMAFSEAIRAYDYSKGNFLVFAQNIINKRLIDYFRKETKYSSHIIENIGLQEEINNDIDSYKSVNDFESGTLNNYRRLEITQLQLECKAWGITFADLVKASPKHEKTLKIYKSIVNSIIQNNELVIGIKTKKTLPIKELEIISGVPRKTIERARKYILAALIIITGDYEFINDYVDWRPYK